MTTDHRVAERRLIVNADDFGQTDGINDGIIECHEHGVLTSASLMVRWPAAAAAATYARARPALSVGLHIDLGEWVSAGGEWMVSYHVVDVDDADAVAAEVGRQLETFRRLMGTDPTHLDSHQHVHRFDPVNRVVADLGMALGVPVRGATQHVSYVGSFYGQGPQGDALDGALTVDHFAEIIQALPPGVTELGCHPGLRDDGAGMYVREREREVRVLCDPAVRATLDRHAIQLVSFRELQPLASQTTRL